MDIIFNMYHLGQIKINGKIIAVALFVNDVCRRYAILEEEAISRFELYNSNLILPEILTKEDGILGLTTSQFSFMGSSKFPIEYIGPEEFTKEKLLTYIREENLLDKITLQQII